MRKVNATMSLEIAKEIQRQLGNRALFMIGAKNLVAIKDGLQFSIMRGAKDGINKIVIKLEPSDTYTVQFWKIGRAPKYQCTMISEHDDIYCDMLHDLILEKTGLALRL